VICKAGIVAPDAQVCNGSLYDTLASYTLDIRELHSICRQNMSFKCAVNNLDSTHVGCYHGICGKAHDADAVIASLLIVFYSVRHRV
jgi:hypothetical protein